MKTLCFTLLLVSSLVSAQSTWKADKAHSNINFTVTHLLISEVTGSFSSFDIILILYGAAHHARAIQKW